MVNILCIYVSYYTLVILFSNSNCIFQYSAPNPADVDAFKTVLDHEVHKVESRLEEFGDLLKRLKVKCK